MADNTHRGRPIHRKTIPRRLSDRCHSHILAVLHRDGSTPCTKRWPSRDDHKVGHPNVSTPNLILIVTYRWLCLLLDSLSFGCPLRSCSWPPLRLWGRCWLCKCTMATEHWLSRSSRSDSTTTGGNHAEHEIRSNLADVSVLWCPTRLPTYLSEGGV